MKTIDPAYIEALKNVVKKSPFPRHVSVVLEHIEMDRADIVIDLADYHLQILGIVHGGVVATAIDMATFWAAFLRLAETDGLVNIDLKLNYLQPVSGGRLTAKGTCLRSGKSLSYSEAKVFDDDNRLIAHGASTLKVLRGKGLKLGVGKFLEDK